MTRPVSYSLRRRNARASLPGVGMVRAGDVPPLLDPTAAYGAAATYVAIQRPGMLATIATNAQRVDVHISMTIPLTFMRLAGLSSATIEANGTAEPRTGITEAED